MERLKNMKDTLISCVQGQLANLSQADTKELGEAVDMIKDLSEAIYYCEITKAMEESKEESKHREKYQAEMAHRRTYYEPWMERDMDKEMMRRMYYPNPDYITRVHDDSTNWGGVRYYTDPRYDMNPIELRDSREGRSSLTRKTYMEGKEMKRGKEMQMKELEKYIQELGTDITEMIQDASPEEKQMLQSKISTLATKIK